MNCALILILLSLVAVYNRIRVLECDELFAKELWLPGQESKGQLRLFCSTGGSVHWMSSRGFFSEERMVVSCASLQSALIVMYRMYDVVDTEWSRDLDRADLLGSSLRIAPGS